MIDGEYWIFYPYYILEFFFTKIMCYISSRLFKKNNYLKQVI